MTEPARKGYSADDVMSSSQAISIAGGCVFAFAVFHLLPGMPHRDSLFRIAGWLVTSGWLLQQWENSERVSGIRRRLTETLKIPRGYNLTSLLLVVLFLSAMPFILALGVICRILLN
jgi:hypothetical protein